MGGRLFPINSPSLSQLYTAVDLEPAKVNLTNNFHCRSKSMWGPRVAAAVQFLKLVGGPRHIGRHAAITLLMGCCSCATAETSSYKIMRKFAKTAKVLFDAADTWACVFNLLLGKRWIWAEECGFEVNNSLLKIPLKVSSEALGLHCTDLLLILYNTEFN